MAASPSFGLYTGAVARERPWAASLVASAVIYLGIGVTVVLVGSATRRIVKEKGVDLTFVEKVVQEPPPAAPVAPEVKPQAPAAAAPVVRPDQKIRHLDKPPPPKEMVAPKDMPTEVPREADPSQDKGVAVYGDEGKGDPAGLEGGVTQGGVVGGIVGGAIAVPEGATPPRPLASNVKPPYPAEAKASGKTGTVVLKIIVLADGTVAQVQVLRGEEPFVSAAVRTAKTWRFEPARNNGQPITVYIPVQIPFKLNA
jgi:protein TonB